MRNLLPLVLAGMVMVGIGTFFAQATATGFVSQAATGDRGAASGLYLASYFLGGLIGAALLGQLFDRLGVRLRRRLDRLGVPHIRDRGNRPMPMESAL